MAENNENFRTGTMLNLIAGIWLIISPYIFGYVTGGIRNNNVWTGIAVAILAIIGLTVTTESWTRWLNVIAGFWLIVSAFVYSYSGPLSLIWNNVIVGVLVVAFATWSVNAISNYNQHHRHLPA